MIILEELFFSFLVMVAVFVIAGIAIALVGLLTALLVGAL
jgi:hypothetical protein